MRKPDIVIQENYLRRWHIIPRNKYFNIYLHQFLGSDPDQNMHDHPWWSLSILLKGSIMEDYRPKGTSENSCYVRGLTRFLPIIRSPELLHRLDVLEGPAWTLFITGPVVRRWGFWKDGQWIDFADYLNNKEMEKEYD